MTIEQALYDIIHSDSETAFRFIFDSCYDRIFRTAYYYLKDDGEAHDVALDVLAKIWNDRRNMIQPTNSNNFLFIITKNASINRLKNATRHASKECMSMSDTIGESIVSDSRGPHETVEDEELFRLYEDALSQLPQRCRTVFTLVKEDGLSYNEVASRLGISPKTVDAQVQKAVKHLRTALGRYLDDSGSKRSIILSLLA